MGDDDDDGGGDYDDDDDYDNGGDELMINISILCLGYLYDTELQFV
jgi:hypothetical protein